MSGQTTILAGDDMRVFREGLRTIIAGQPDMLNVARAGDSPQALEAFRRDRPEVTLMDQFCPSATGIETMANIRREFPKAKIIMLTSFDGDIEIQHALRAGALAYVLKNTETHELVEIIRKVHAGRICIPSNVASKL